MKIPYLLLVLFISFVAYSCQKEEQKKLPILGERDVENGDTIFHSIPDFTFINQDSAEVNNATFANKAYVVDFFFTTCPTLCPRVKKQMLRIYKEFENEEDLLFLSHTIDPKRDSVKTLKTYSNNLGVSADRWQFVTGDKAEIYEIADDYFSIVLEDSEAPGGFDHSGRLILVDANRHIRSFCNGTDEKDVDRFMEDIKVLLDEMHGNSGKKE